MKKLKMFLLCVGLMLLAAGCGKKEDTAWIDESAAKIDAELTSGQFVIDGVVYTFPMDLQYWLDNGWHISNNYNNKNTFKLDAWYNSDEFELFNEEGDWVRVSAYNNSDTAAKLDQCMVYSVYMSTAEVDVVLPSGMTKRNSTEELLATYGDPYKTDEETSTVENGYLFEQGDEWQCMVTLKSYKEDAETPLSGITYQMMFFDDFWNTWLEVGGAELAVEKYVNADLKASFSGDYEDAVVYGLATEETAKEWHDTEKAYYTEVLMWYVGIDSTYMDDATLERFNNVSDKVLKKASWEVKNVTADALGSGTATVVVYPANFLDIIVDGVDTAITEWNTKYANVDLDTISDAEYAVLELDYADMILKVMEAKTAEMGAAEAVELKCELDINNSVLTDDSWLNIYDAMMDLYYEE